MKVDFFRSSRNVSITAEKENTS